MERCPCCNVRLGDAATCRRCRTDLNKTLAAEQLAQFWMCQAIRFCLENEVKQSLKALEQSLNLESSPLALSLREFLIDRLCREILDLLAQHKVVEAKRQLFQVTKVIPQNELLQQLHSYTDYLLIKGHPCFESRRTKDYQPAG